MWFSTYHSVQTPYADTPGSLVAEFPIHSAVEIEFQLKILITSEAHVFTWGILIQDMLVSCFLPKQPGVSRALPGSAWWLSS